MIATVESITPAQENRPWRVKFQGGMVVSTFKDEVIGDLRAGSLIEAEVHDSENTAKDGRKFTNHTLLSWTLRQAPPEKVEDPRNGETPVAYQADGSPVPAEVWAAKDRASYMESAYKSACQAFLGKGDTKEARHNITVFARWIYAEIMLAHNDEPLPKVEA